MPRRASNFIQSKPEEFSLTIESVAYGGKGVGHRNGKVIFVPGTLPGDRIRARVRSDKKHHTNADIVDIIEPSPIRTPAEPGFIVPGTALPYSPGYCYFNTSYADEVGIKQAQFKGLLTKGLNLADTAVLPPQAAPEPVHYRNKIKLHAEDDRGDIRLGYVASNNVTVLDLPRCPLAVTPINDALIDLNNQPGFRHSLRHGMELTLRYTEHNGVIHWRNKPPRNQSWLKEETALGTISVPCGSFFQVNMPVCNLLLDRIQSYLKNIAPSVVLDFFCGIGLFSIAAAKVGIDMTIGIDLDPLAIDAAKYNGKQHELKNCQFIAGDAGKHAKEVLQTYSASQACLIVDPPRTGMDTRCAQIVANSGIHDILYISCSSDTLVRDCILLGKSGYRIVETQLLDMFPRTAHFESLTYLRLE